MLTDILRQLYARDLNKLKSEIEQYQNEERIWYTEKSISNSAGNLCLHLVGNLNTYFGAVYGNTGYIRNRDLEFSQKNISRDILIEKIVATMVVVDSSLSAITQAQLDAEYPLLVFQQKTSTEFFLVHLSAHFSYHLGQINYHRRLLDVAPSI